MKQVNFRTALVVTLLVVLFLGGLLYYHHTTSLRSLAVVFRNTQSVVVVDISDGVEGGKEKQIAIIKKSGDTVKIPKNISVFVRYTGAEGYADGFENGSGKTVTINPDYSRQKISEIISSQNEQIKSAVFDSINNGKLYTLDTGTLYDHGVWYISKLRPVSNPEGNLDTLRVILQNKAGSWELASQPNIVFTKFNTPSVPVAVLDFANTY